MPYNERTTLLLGGKIMKSKKELAQDCIQDALMVLHCAPLNITNFLNSSPLERPYLYKFKDCFPEATPEVKKLNKKLFGDDLI
jgi:hypothetical protein